MSVCESSPSDEPDPRMFEDLKRELQELKSSEFEKLVAALIGKLLDLRIAVAKSGFQFGGDAGPAGRQGRRFRLECKRYKGTTSLSDREVLGEIDDALSRDKALEAWILIATRTVPEQLALKLSQKGESCGVPVIIIDWPNQGASALAALCTVDIGLVENYASSEAGTLCRKIKGACEGELNLLRRELQEWALGFDSVRDSSLGRLESIWNKPREANSHIGQDVAGGYREAKVKREEVSGALNNWLSSKDKSDAPFVVIGRDGVGKTWAVLDWLVAREDTLPIVVIVPSSASADIGSVSELGIKEFIADQLYQITGVRDPSYWKYRLDLLLRRPCGEGPVITLFFDGLNQEPSIRWDLLCKVLQGEKFAGRVKLIATTRTHHFDGRLSRLSGLIVPAESFEVDIYNDKEGGEFDQMLDFEGLVREDLSPDLIPLARVPRLFDLVIRMREKLIDAGKVTVHRLLWEYGRNTLGQRAGRSFSESDWRDWLRRIAENHRDGIRNYSVRLLGNSVGRPDLSESEVFSRLSDIIDGSFSHPGGLGEYSLSETMVAHALGATLLAQLDNIEYQDYDILDAEIASWLDPISGFDERAEILRAAVSILVHREDTKSSPAAGVLLTNWLQSQNVPDEHRYEIGKLAPNLPDGLLDVIEKSTNHAHSSARHWAIRALRTIPKSDSAALELLIRRARDWLCVVSMNINTHGSIGAEAKKRKLEWYKNRIGVAEAGRVKVLHNEFHLVDSAEEVLQKIVPSILDGFPLAGAISIFETAAIGRTLEGSGDAWTGLKWICFLNNVDPVETAEAIRMLSNNLQKREPENGIHHELPAMVAKYLLYLSGEECDNETASEIDYELGKWYRYSEYLENPSQALYPLERRHAAQVLEDSKLTVEWRIRRTEKMWLDPDFEPPSSFVMDLRNYALGVNITELNSCGQMTREDLDFELIEPVLARCQPEVLCDLVRRKLQGFADSPSDARYWKAIRAPQHLLLVREEEASAAKLLRCDLSEPDENYEAVAASELLMIELPFLSAYDQFATLIQANIKYIEYSAEVLKTPSKEDVDRLISDFGAVQGKRQCDLLTLLSILRIEYSENGISWLLSIFKADGFHATRFVYRILAEADPVRFGAELESCGFSWDPNEDDWINHFGTKALVLATKNIPFIDLVPRLAPWKLLEAVRLRGSKIDEVRQAVVIFDKILKADGFSEFDSGAALEVDRSDVSCAPFSFSVTGSNEETSKLSAIESLKRALDQEGRTAERSRAIDVVVERVTAARKDGASLCFVNFQYEDFLPLIEHAGNVVEGWVDDVGDLSSRFTLRVQLAEGMFVALCEALLNCRLELGAKLWRALWADLSTRFIGRAGIDELLHMVFRVAESPTVLELREDLLIPENSGSDKVLYNLTVAACVNGKAEWLKRRILKDNSSSRAWERKRGKILQGFMASNELPVDGAWPSGELKLVAATFEAKCARSQWKEACAHHWFIKYLSAEDSVQAYSFWVLFLRSADSRVWVWIEQEIESARDDSDLYQLKLANIRLNRSKLKQAVEKSSRELEKTFLDRKIIDNVSPWFKEV